MHQASASQLQALPFSFLKSGACLLIGILLACTAFAQPAAKPKIPVIFDTDIGSDIDDTWALALLLQSPELDLKMVVTDSHDVEGRARIVAKFLQAVGRTDVEIGIGARLDMRDGAQFEWAAGYDLNSYPGKLHKDGVAAMVEKVMTSPEPITLIVVGPAPNIQEALRREPNLPKKARVVAMSGSVYKGYGGKSQPEAEYNVKDHVASSQAMYRAGWDKLIAPLDTCGLIHLQGDDYQRVLRSTNPICRTLIENYRVWNRNSKTILNPDIQSSTLFDCLAVFLAYSTDFLEIESVRLEVTPDGYTKISDQGNEVRAAVRWKSLDGFQKFLVERLTR